MPTIPLTIPKNIDKYFYNRENDIKKIKFYLNGLNENIPQQLLLTGYRGVGKTFLLQKIKKDYESDFLVTYIDIFKIYSKFGGKLNSEAILLEMLDDFNNHIKGNENSNLKKLYMDIKNFKNTILRKKFDFKESGNTLGIAIPSFEEKYNKLSDYVMNLPQKIIDNSEYKGFIIIIDEFQLIKEVENPNAFFGLIRSYAQFQSNVAYIITGSTSRTSDVVEMINGENGAFGGRMIQINIDPFTKEETKNYFKDRLDIKFTKEGFDQFYKCTRGIPAYINNFYNIMSKDIVYDAENIKNIFRENNEQILVMWIRIWGTLNNYEKNILISLCVNGKSKWTNIIENTKISKNTLNNNLSNLKNKGIIEYTKPYYFIQDNMLKTWILQEKERNGFYPL